MRPTAWCAYLVISGKLGKTEGEQRVGKKRDGSRHLNAGFRTGANR